MHRSLRVDGHGNGRIGRNKSSSCEQPNPGRAERWRTYVVIHSRNTPSCECGARRGTRGGQTQIPAPEAGILRIHCPHTMKVTVPTLSKDSIGGLHGIPETMTLLSRVFNHSGLLSTT